jgi:hypothetical protein
LHIIGSVLITVRIACVLVCASAQRSQERLDLPPLLCAQTQRLEFAVARGCLRCAVVVFEDFSERAELAGVHIRRALRYVPQRGHLERAFQHMVAGHEKLELRALRTAVAPAAPAVELVTQHGIGSREPSRVCRKSRARRHAGVVELVVREQGAVVAVHTACLADEEP